jgi:bifunctional N-acetylglucosamine-1-phosphate-uridyltransferase/glucosamine-1-phosphate-acetyltransferase GlmU-like protein
MQKEGGKIKIVILAAGKGVRMESEKPKAFLEVHGQSMLGHIHASSVASSAGQPLTVIADSAQDLFKSTIGNSAPYVLQHEQLGTGHALLVAENELKNFEHIMVLYADQPFTKSATIQAIIKKHLASGATITFATTTVPDFEKIYGVFKSFARILRKDEKIIGIREYKDASAEEKNIKELNAGCYIFEAKWLWQNLKMLDRNNVQKEYYLTDLIKKAAGEGARIETLAMPPYEALGANSKEELEMLEKLAV